MTSGLRRSLVALLMVTAGCAWVVTIIRDRGATDEHWRALAASMNVLPSDAIVVLPAWQLRALMFLPSDQVSSADGLSSWPTAMLHKHPRLWVIDEHNALQDLPTTDITAALLATPVVAAQGPLRARLLTSSSTSQLLTVKDAAVTVDGNKGGSVSERWTLATENGVRAITMQAPSLPSQLVMRWRVDAVPHSLVVFAGHPRESARTGSAVTIIIVIDGEEVATLQRQPSFAIEPSRRVWRDWFVPGASHDDERGYRASVQDLSSLSPGPHDIELRISAQGAATAFAIDAFLSDAP